MTNARKFINSYNKIDGHLRSVGNFKASQSFSDIVRRSAEKNLIVRKYENELIDYARLRNAIVHNSIDERIIAEPSDEVTEKIAVIEKLLISPPLISDIFKDKNIVGVESGVSLKEVIRLIGRSGYSNIPVYQNGIMTGIVNPKRIVTAISRVLGERGDINGFLNSTCCSGITHMDDLSVYYTILSKKCGIDKIAQSYENNKKLRAVLITENGKLGEKVVNLLTPSDLAVVNKILEDY